jgi:hypothetical protein
MRTWGKPSQVGEIEVLRNQESCIPLRRFPKLAIGAATQIFISNRVNVVTEIRQDRAEARRKILIELDFSSQVRRGIRSIMRNDIRRGWYRQIFTGRGSCKRYGSLHILSFQSRKIGKDLFDSISLSQTRQDRAQSHPSAAEGGLSAANLWVPHDSVFVVHPRISLSIPYRSFIGHHSIQEKGLRGLPRSQTTEIAAKEKLISGFPQPSTKKSHPPQLVHTRVIFFHCGA